jgi:hypothetical protein
VSAIYISIDILWVCVVRVVVVGERTDVTGPVGVEKAQDLALIFLLDLFLSLVRLPVIQDPQSANAALAQEKKKKRRREENSGIGRYRRKSFSMWASSSLICADLPTSPQNAVSNLAPGIFLSIRIGPSYERKRDKRSDVSAAPPVGSLSSS